MVALQQGWIEVERPDQALAQGQPVASELEPTPGMLDVPAVALGGDTAQATSPGAPTVALPHWQQLYLIGAILLAAVGLWLIWPRAAAPAEPFTDRPAPASDWVPGPSSRWQSLAQMPRPRSRLAVVAQNGRIYAIHLLVKHWQLGVTVLVIVSIIVFSSKGLTKRRHKGYGSILEIKYNNIFLSACKPFQYSIISLNNGNYTSYNKIYQYPL